MRWLWAGCCINCWRRPFLLLSLEGLILRALWWFIRIGLAFIAFRTNPGLECFSLFALFLELLLGSTLGYLHLSEDSDLKVVAAPLYQCGYSHATQTSKSHISKLLNEGLYQLVFPLLGFNQSSCGDLQIIIKESCQEETFKVTEGFNGPRLKLQEPIKG